MSGEVIDKAVREKALTACKDYIGGEWRNISTSELKITKLSGGFSNTIYRCSLPENAAREAQENSAKVPTDVLLRIYGSFQEDRNLLVAGAVSFMMLSERGLGPKLYGLLPDGRLEEFIPSHSLSTVEMCTYGGLIARELAKIHVLDVPLRKVPDTLAGLCSEMLDGAEDALHKDDKQYFMSSSEYRKEFEWVTKEMAKTNSPVVYCHNDLQRGNILLREDVPQGGKPRIVLIDLELACYNYREMDFASYFFERCVSYNTPEYPHFEINLDNFPSMQEQIDFFTVYLDQLSREGVSPTRSLEEEIQTMLSEINLFVAAFNLFVSIWCAKMTLQPADARFQPKELMLGYKEHGKARSKLYLKFKEQHLASLSNSSSNKF